MYKELDQDGYVRAHPIRPDGTVVWIESDERKYVLKHLGNTITLIEERLSQGWSAAQAMYLSPNYVTKDGVICYLFDRKGYEVYIPINDLERAEVDLGLQRKTICNRLGKGYSLHEALTTPVKRRWQGGTVSFSTMMTNEKAKEKRRSKEAVKRMRERKYREEKPHLFDGTPQQHARGAYTEYLMQNDIFPKVVK